MPSLVVGGAARRNAALSRTPCARAGWFTEGFDTPDLRDARALLDALG
jgi:hypothetical protein